MFVPRSAVFESQQADETFYDAYEKDLAIAHFFLASPTVIQFSKTARTTQAKSVLKKN